MNKHIGYKILIAVTACIVIGMLVMAVFYKKKQRIDVMAENERVYHKLMGTLNEGIQTLMLEGDADIVNNFLDSLRNVSEIEKLELIRTDGLAAFYDNKTIHNVNQRIGDEEYMPRDTEKEVQAVADEMKTFSASINQARIASYYENDENGNQYLTLFMPLLNQEKCYSCHGSNHDVRGVVKLTTSLEQVNKNIKQNWLGSMVWLAVINTAIIIVIWYLVRMISRPIKRIASELQDISDGEGNLNVSLEVKGQDEIAQLSAGFNTFVSKTRKVVQNFAGVTGELRDMARQLAETTNRTNKNVSNQRVDIQGIANSVENMTITINHIAQNAQQGATIAHEVDKDCLDGKTEMERTTEAMKHLADRVEDGVEAIQNLNQEMVNIGSILGVIREISDQTNLLALNATIEAARVGEKGRGFAVVADEIRRLAERSNSSAQEIEEIIKHLGSQISYATDIMQDGRKQAELSVEQVDRSGQALENITDASSRISSISKEIANAVTEEKKIFNVIIENVEHINEIAEKTTEDSNDTTVKSDELAHLSERLQSLVSQFKT
jgi:methyl-accepting chemotaxis protein